MLSGTTPISVMDAFSCLSHSISQHYESQQQLQDTCSDCYDDDDEDPGNDELDEDDMKHIVDDVSDDEGDEEAGQVMRKQLEQREEKERHKEMMRRMREGFLIVGVSSGLGDGEKGAILFSSSPPRPSKSDSSATVSDISAVSSLRRRRLTTGKRLVLSLTSSLRGTDSCRRGYLGDIPSIGNGKAGVVWLSHRWSSCCLPRRFLMAMIRFFMFLARGNNVHEEGFMGVGGQNQHGRN